MEGGIRVVLDLLEDVVAEAVVRPIRTDLDPVNAVSKDLLTAAGEAAETRLMNLGSLPLGGAVMAPGGDLPADFIIHVVVMSEDEPQTAATVRKAVSNALRRASDWALASLAFPPLGISVGTIEPEEAAATLVEILVEHLEAGQPPLDLIIAVSSPYEAELFEGLVGKMSRDGGDDD